MFQPLSQALQILVQSVGGTFRLYLWIPLTECLVAAFCSGPVRSSCGNSFAYVRCSLMQGSQGEVLLHLIFLRLHSVHASTVCEHRVQVTVDIPMVGIASGGR